MSGTLETSGDFSFLASESCFLLLLIFTSVLAAVLFA